MTMLTNTLIVLSLLYVFEGHTRIDIQSVEAFQFQPTRHPAFPSVLSSTTEEQEAKTTTSVSATATDVTPITKDDVSNNVVFETKEQKLIHNFCVGTNNFWKQLVIKPVRDYVEIRPAKSYGTTQDVLSKLIAPPELPGISRPVWFTILGSVPTALGWYGYYKFCVEEELYQYELQNNKPVTGCGGYGTLFPFVYGFIVGFPLSLVPVDGSDFVLKAAAFWILAGQVNLYRRVNELCRNSSRGSSTSTSASEEMERLYSEQLNGEPPLWEWWALLPPPLDVVVGLRQVHFLSEYWRIQRGEAYNKDIIAEELFPFISAPRFTLKQFFRTPSMWFWFTKGWDDFDFEFLQD